jgi:hypothetical protein
MTQGRIPREGDASQRAWSLVQEATGQAERTSEKYPAAIAGGLARAEQLTAERRREIAVLGVKSRREN